MHRNRFLILFILCSQLLQAQLPTTHMHRFSLSSQGKGVEVTEALYLNNFNKTGYNNQMQFMGDVDKLLISSNAYYPDSTNDVLLLDFNDLSLERMTLTSESEYSPTPIAADAFTCVRVEKDGKDQGLWEYNFENKEYPEQRLLHNLDNIGYHLWLDEEKLILFLVDQPNFMALAYPEDGSFKVLDSKIGRCFKRINDDTFYYVHKLSDDTWELKSYDLNTGKKTRILEMPPGVEDFELLQDGTIICGKNAQILIYNRKKNSEEWLPYVDLSPFGLKNITRLIMQKNILITVSE